MGFLLLFDYYAGPQIAALSSVSIFRRKLIVFIAGAAETTSSDRAGLYFAYGDTNDNVNALVTNSDSIPCSLKGMNNAAACSDLPGALLRVGRDGLRRRSVRRTA
jgi:hypothetical protein